MSGHMVAEYGIDVSGRRRAFSPGCANGQRTCEARAERGGAGPFRGARPRRGARPASRGRTRRRRRGRGRAGDRGSGCGAPGGARRAALARGRAPAMAIIDAGAAAHPVVSVALAAWQDSVWGVSLARRGGGVGGVACAGGWVRGMCAGARPRALRMSGRQASLASNPGPARGTGARQARRAAPPPRAGRAPAPGRPRRGAGGAGRPRARAAAALTNGDGPASYRRLGAPRAAAAVVAAHLKQLRRKLSVA